MLCSYEFYVEVVAELNTVVDWSVAEDAAEEIASIKCRLDALLQRVNGVAGQFGSGQINVIPPVRVIPVKMFHAGHLGLLEADVAPINATLTWYRISEE